MLKTLRPHLLLAAAFFCLILGQQYIFFLLRDLPLTLFSWYRYVILFFYLFTFTFIKGPKIRLVFLSAMLLISFFQMGHYSYYATPVVPSEIYLGLQVGEIGGVLAEESQHVLIPLFMTLIPLILGFLVWRKSKVHYQYFGMTAAVIALILFFPVRTYVTGNDWGKDPSSNEVMAINLYGSVSFFLGRILPHKITGGILPSQPNSSMYLKFVEAKKNQDWDKVIVVIGESLSTRHMSLYGYQRPTTPFLDSIKSDPNFFHTTGISSGVNTDVSVSFFLNMAFGSPGKLKSSLGEHCMFKLAKNLGYRTHLLSIQSNQQLQYIAPYVCSTFLDDFKPLELVAPHTKDQMAARDRDLLPVFKEVLDKDSSDFVVLHQRGSHGPWGVRSTPESKIFSAAKKKDRPIADYDNSVVEFDLFMRDLLTMLKRSDKKTLVVYLSDHGEALGENGRWGHGVLIREAFEVPVIITSVNRSLPPAVTDLPQVLTQYGLGLFITEQLGLVANQKSSEQVKDFAVYGNDIDGFAGSAALDYLSDGKYQVKLIPY